MQICDVHYQNGILLNLMAGPVEREVFKPRLVYQQFFDEIFCRRRDVFKLLGVKVEFRRSHVRQRLTVRIARKRRKTRQSDTADKTDYVTLDCVKLDQCDFTAVRFQ